MGRSVFTDTDRVVAPDKQHLRLGQRRETNCGSHVVGEHEEGTDDGDRSAVQRHPVCDRAHRVLAHAEIDLPAARVSGGEHAVILDHRAGVPGEVGTAAGEARHEFEHGLERCTRRLSGGDAVAGFVDGQVLVPAGHTGAGELSLKCSSVAAERAEPLLPRLALGTAAQAGGPVRLEHVGGHVEGLVDGHAHRCFGCGDLLVEDGVTVCLVGVGRLGRRGSDDRADDD